MSKTVFRLVTVDRFADFLMTLGVGMVLGFTLPNVAATLVAIAAILTSLLLSMWIWRREGASG
jgi:hypothetical protein